MANIPQNPHFQRKNSVNRFPKITILKITMSPGNADYSVTGHFGAK